MLLKLKSALALCLLTIDFLEFFEELALILDRSFVKLRIVQEVIDLQDSRRYRIDLLLPALDVILDCRMLLHLCSLRHLALAADRR